MCCFYLYLKPDFSSSSVNWPIVTCTNGSGSPDQKVRSCTFNQLTQYTLSKHPMYVYYQCVYVSISNSNFNFDSPILPQRKSVSQRWTKQNVNSGAQNLQRKHMSKSLLDFDSLPPSSQVELAVKNAKWIPHCIHIDNDRECLLSPAWTIASM